MCRGVGLFEKCVDACLQTESGERALHLVSCHRQTGHVLPSVSAAFTLCTSTFLKTGVGSGK